MVDVSELVDCNLEQEGSVSHYSSPQVKGQLKRKV